MNTTDWFVFIQQEHYFAPKCFAGVIWYFEVFGLCIGRSGEKRESSKDEVDFIIRRANKRISKLCHHYIVENI
jgi:hypothetical protein